MKLKWLLLLVFVVGCAKDEVAVDPEANDLALQILSYRLEEQHPLPTDVKFVLVAGGDDIANFGEEVVLQKRHWLKQGFQANEIACYYTIPKNGAFLGDEKQFRALAADLNECYAATPGQVARHLRQVVENNPPFLYFYSSSHGSLPLSLGLKKWKLTDDQRAAIEKSLVENPDQDSYQLGFNADPRHINGGVTPRSADEPAFFSPRLMKDALQGGEAIPKFIVIQACYSGGFLEAPDRFGGDALGGVPSLTMMTASRFDRSSFGCAGGLEQTFFGGIYNESLSRLTGSPTEIDWRALYNTVNVAVGNLETEKKATPPSEPQFGVFDAAGTPLKMLSEALFPADNPAVLAVGE